MLIEFGKNELYKRYSSEASFNFNELQDIQVNFKEFRKLRYHFIFLLYDKFFLIDSNYLLPDSYL